MYISEVNEENIKLTVIDDEEENDKCYFEIVVNRNFLNTVFLSLLMLKNEIPPLDVNLTNREKEVLSHIAKGEDNREIAESMNVSIHTAKIHIRNIFQKLDVKDRTEAVIKAVKHNMIDIFS